MFKRLLYYLYGKSTGRKARRLTREGALILMTLLLWSLLLRSIFPYLLAFLLFPFLWSRFFRLRVHVQRILPKFGTVGEPLEYRIILHNATATRQKGLDLVENFEGTRLTFTEFVNTPAPGEEELSRFSRMFLGYRRRWLGLQSVLILPKRYDIPAIRLPGMRKFQIGGVALASSVGESQEFASLREYRPGDPLRRIHWKSWAKTGKPIVKEYHDEYFVRHALVLDTFHQAAYSDLFEEAVSVAASFACTVRTQDSFPYVMICITGAGLKPGTSNMFLFYLGIVLLLAWMFWSFRSRRYSPVVWISILAVIFLLGYVGQTRLLVQWDHVLGRHGSVLSWFRGLFPRSGDPYQSTTAIGDIGTLKLSNHVVFRVRSETGPHPELLLRESSYHRYQASSRSSSSQVQFVTIPPEADETTWNIQPEPTPRLFQEGNIPTPNLSLVRIPHSM